MTNKPDKSLSNIQKIMQKQDKAKAERSGQISTLGSSSNKDEASLVKSTTKTLTIAQDEMPPESPLLKQSHKNSSKEESSEVLSPDKMDDFADQLFFADNLALRDDRGGHYSDGDDRLETEIEKEPAKDDTPDSLMRESMFLQFGKMSPENEAEDSNRNSFGDLRTKSKKRTRRVTMVPQITPEMRRKQIQTLKKKKVGTGVLSFMK